MVNKKRTRDGQVKPPAPQQSNVDGSTQDIAMTDVPPPCAPVAPPSHTPSKQQGTQNKRTPPNKQSSNPPPTQSTKTPKLTPKPRERRQKLPKLPKNTSITRRPLLHPPLPTPYSSSLSPKTLYITHSTPFIPSVKRIRKLLSLANHRGKQALAASQNFKHRGSKKTQDVLRANGRLSNIAVERSISDEANRANGTAKEQNIIADKEKDKDKEKVYLKASGRAIPRALEIGVYFQAEEDCAVKIEMGSVRVIDDIVVRDGPEADSDGGQDGVEDMDVPETRIRTISSVTVSVWLKGGGSLRDKKQVRELV